MRRSRIILGFVTIVLMYLGTWAAGHFSLHENLHEEAQSSYLRAQKSNREEVELARLTGTAPPFLIPLHEGGPITSEGCVPLVPCIVLRHWSSSIGPLGGGGGRDLYFVYGFGSTHLRS